MSILIRDVQVEGDVTQVYIEGNRIVEIGKKREADTVIDGKGKIALPGFVNLHTHAAMTLFRGWGDDLELSTWLETKIWPAEARLTPDDVYWGTKLASLEMIKTGTTTFNDMYFHMDGAARAVKEMGLRAFLAEGIVDLNDAERAAKQLRTADEVNRRIEALKTDRITPVLGPHAIYTVSKDSLLRIREIADKTGSLIHIHLSETKREVDDCVMPAIEAFQLANFGGARALGVDAGLIGVDRLADIILVDPRRPELTPRHDDISNWVYSAHGNIVDTTICDGVVLMRGRRVRGEAEILEKAAGVARDLVSRV